ncbi:sugar ABC transporter substrate-binding protein [Paenibacillus sp. MCAF20]
MRKMVMVLLGIVCLTLCFFTFVSAGKAFRSDWRLPQTEIPKQTEYRLVLITQELETTFWDKVGHGAVEQARKDGASLEVWGSYADMGQSGNVILLGDTYQEYYQKQRLAGIQDVLKDYKDVRTAYAETEATREQVIATTKDLMNRVPDADAFIAVNAGMASAMLHEIGRRSQIGPYHIYSFDDGRESEELFEQGKLDGMIEQSPEKMGELSVKLMMEWLSGETVPLEMDGYLTDIRMAKAMEAR